MAGIAQLGGFPLNQLNQDGRIGCLPVPFQRYTERVPQYVPNLASDSSRGPYHEPSIPWGLQERDGHPMPPHLFWVDSRQPDNSGEPHLRGPGGDTASRLGCYPTVSRNVLSADVNTVIGDHVYDISAQYPQRASEDGPFMSGGLSSPSSDPTIVLGDIDHGLTDNMTVVLREWGVKDDATTLRNATRWVQDIQSAFGLAGKGDRRRDTSENDTIRMMKESILLETFYSNKSTDQTMNSVMNDFVSSAGLEFKGMDVDSKETRRSEITGRDVRMSSPESVLNAAMRSMDMTRLANNSNTKVQSLMPDRMHQIANSWLSGRSDVDGDGFSECEVQAAIAASLADIPGVSLAPGQHQETRQDHNPAFDLSTAAGPNFLLPTGTQDEVPTPPASFSGPGTHLDNANDFSRWEGGRPPSPSPYRVWRDVPDNMFVDELGGAPRGGLPAYDVSGRDRLLESAAPRSVHEPDGRGRLFDPFSGSRNANAAGSHLGGTGRSGQSGVVWEPAERLPASSTIPATALGPPTVEWPAYESTFYPPSRSTKHRSSQRGTSFGPKRKFKPPFGADTSSRLASKLISGFAKTKTKRAACSTMASRNGVSKKGNLRTMFSAFQRKKPVKSPVFQYHGGDIYSRYHSTFDPSRINDASDLRAEW